MFKDIEANLAPDSITETELDSNSVPTDIFDFTEESVASPEVRVKSGRDLRVLDNLVVDGNAEVTTDLTVSGSVDVTGGLTASSTVDISGDTTIEGQLSITGVSSIIVTKNDAQAFPTGATTKIEYDDEVEDNLDEYDSVTNHNATVIKAGRYLVIAGLTLATAAWDVGEFAQLRVYVDNTATHILSRREFDAYRSDPATLSGSCILKLSAGAVVDIRVYHNRGASTNCTTVASYNYFMMHRIS